MYPEVSLGIPLESLTLTEYDETVIIPEMIKFGIPRERWGDCIDWYHKKSAQVIHIKKEFPTTLDEIMSMGENKKVFSEESIATQKKNILLGKPYRFLTDNVTRQVEAKETDISPFRIFVPPLYGHKYKVTVDPITAVNEESDYFAMSVFDENKMEQVAVFYGNGLPLEDYADYAVSIAKIYNNALIVPESNVAAAFVTSVYNLRYYNFFYETPKARKDRVPGIRTTVSSKERIVDNLKLLLDTNQITLHDEETVNELEWFEKKVKNKIDGGVHVSMAARKGKHDDMLASVAMFVGSLNQSQLAGHKRSGISFL